MVVEVAEASTAAVVVVAFTVVAVEDSRAVVVVAASLVVAAAVFIAGAEEDSTAGALPVAVAGSVAADIVAAAPTGACARMVAAHDLLVAEVLTGAVVFGADRQQAGAPTADSVPRAA